MNPKEQLIEMVGKENADHYTQIVKAMMEAEGEETFEAVNQ